MTTAPFWLLFLAALAIAILATYARIWLDRSIAEIRAKALLMQMSARTGSSLAADGGE